MEALVGVAAVVLGVAAVGGLIALLVGVARRARQRFVAALREVARALRSDDLSVFEGSFWKAPNLKGSVGPYSVTLDTYTVDKSTYTRIRVRGGLPPGMIFEKEGAAASFKKVFVGEDVEIGDPRFDESVVARGDEVDLASTLDAPARAAVAQAVRQGIRLRKGELRWNHSGLVKDPAKLIGALRATLKMADVLRAPGSAAERLWTNAQNDPEPGVRARCMWYLLTQFEDSPSARSAHALLLCEAGATPSDEASLLACFSVSSPSLWLAAIEALEDCGTARAVAPLMEVAESGETDVASRARQAIGIIQSRLSGVRGGLSVVAPDSDAGALSLDALAPGGVSLAVSPTVPSDAPEARIPDDLAFE